jgi:DNA-binding protein WhiA
MSGRGKLLLQCPENKTKEVLSALGFIKRNGSLRDGISSSKVAIEENRIAYIQGAFLGGGSCTLPNEAGKTGYHLEVVFSEKQVARDFCKILEEFELLAKLTQRKETHVVYLKSKEVISDFLSVIGVDNSLHKFSQLVEKRDEANHSNRTQNCMAGNADKAATASANQVIAIRRLMKSKMAEEINEELFLTAKARLEHPAKSMQELADYMKISKSCLNHRMRKLIELSNKIEE